MQMSQFKTERCFEVTLWCVGKNYDDHVAEMGGTRPAEPVIFQKASGCIVPYGQPIRLPDWSQEIHHELELAFLLDEHLAPASIALALDLTARDIQTMAKSQGLPWALAKSFKGSCPMTPWISLTDPKVEGWEHLTFQLDVGGNLRQKSQGKNMVWSVAEILTYLQKRFPVEPGDILLTGTPRGVGSLYKGDTLTLTLEGFDSWQWEVN